MSMARLWRSQGEVQQARELLAPVYGLFTQGFDTRDLKEAKALRADGCAHREALLDGTLRSLFPTARRTLVFEHLPPTRRPRNCSQFRPKPRPGVVKICAKYLQPAGFLRDSISQEKSITGEPRSEIASCFVPKTEPCRRQGLIRERMFW